MKHHLMKSFRKKYYMTDVKNVSFFRYFLASKSCPLVLFLARENSPVSEIVNKTRITDKL